MKALVLVALLLAGGGPAYAQDALSRAKTAGGGHAKPVAAPQAPPQNPRAAAASLPATVPEQFSPPQEAYASFAQAGGAAPAKPSACQLRLAKVATFKPIPVLIGAGECGAMDAVMLDGVVLADGAKIVLAPAATLRCTMAEEVAAWLRDDIAPAVLKLGAPLRGLDNFDSYECRGRNRVRGATLSEHGRANALDVRGFKLANGETVELTDVKVAKAWRDGIRSSACERFSTVLGPGSDGHHESTSTSISPSGAAATKCANGMCVSRARSLTRASGRPKPRPRCRRCRRFRSRCRCRARGRWPPTPRATCNCPAKPARNNAARPVRSLFALG